MQTNDPQSTNTLSTSSTIASHSVIIPACGEGIRFGIYTPKHLIDIGGKPMVQRVIDELPSYANIFLLTRPEHASQTRATVEAPNLVVTPVHDYKLGVCQTLLSAPVPLSDKILVVNCDNVISPPGGWHNFLTIYKNAVVTFKEKERIEPPPFSYVRSINKFVVEIAEKRRVGAYACAGAFLFESYEMLCKLCKWHLALDPPDHNMEHYLAPVYNRLIANVHVYFIPLGEDDLFIRMGTPFEATEARSYYVSRDTGF
jgi:molybdopterin-guanine dinucleotide biosynthesis protein A